MWPRTRPRVDKLLQWASKEFAFFPGAAPTSRRPRHNHSAEHKAEVAVATDMGSKIAQLALKNAVHEGAPTKARLPS